MSLDKQETFIRKVRFALAKTSGAPKGRPDVFSVQAEEDYPNLPHKIENRSLDQRLSLLERLWVAGKRQNINVIPLKGAPSVTSSIAELVREKEPEWDRQKSLCAWCHPLIERLNLVKGLGQLEVPVYFTGTQRAEKKTDAERCRIRKQIIASYIGVTSADYCLAETATLVMKSRPGQARSVSAVPSIHIAVIELKQIIWDLKELYAILKWNPAENKEGLTNCLTFISGPSSTRDIEACRVVGAHGPREVFLFVITE
jgi:L-lactate dehydrogenase complex protein LldG